MEYWGRGTGKILINCFFGQMATLNLIHQYVPAPAG
jgi:hypothetical protein